MRKGFWVRSVLFRSDKIIQHVIWQEGDSLVGEISEIFNAFSGGLD